MCHVYVYFSKTCPKKQEVQQRSQIVENKEFEFQPVSKRQINHQRTIPNNRPSTAQEGIKPFSLNIYDAPSILKDIPQKVVPTEVE